MRLWGRMLQDDEDEALVESNGVYGNPAKDRLLLLPGRCQNLTRSSIDTVPTACQPENSCPLGPEPCFPGKLIESPRLKYPSCQMRQPQIDCKQNERDQVRRLALGLVPQSPSNRSSLSRECIAPKSGIEAKSAEIVSITRPPAAKQDTYGTATKPPRVSNLEFSKKLTRFLG